MSKEEIKKAKEKTKKWIYNMRTGRRVNIIHKGDKDFCDDLETLLQYIEQLEQENKALKKGQNSLMASRKKWKDRYYKEKAKFDKANKMVDEMAKAWKQDDYRSIEEIKQYFEKKVE